MSSKLLESNSASFNANWKPFIRQDDRWDLVEKIRTFVLAFTLLPLRIFISLALIIWYHFFLSIVIVLQPTLEWIHFDLGYYVQDSAQPIARFLLYSLGFYWIDYVGGRGGEYLDASDHFILKVNRKDEPRLIVCNHTSWIDILIIFATCPLGTPSFLSKAKVRDIPIIGTASQAWQCLYIDNRTGNSKERISAQVAGRVLSSYSANDAILSNANPRLRPLLLFPEATTTNGLNVIKFRTGAFLSGKPVWPITIHYPSQGKFSPTWETINMLWHTFRLLTQLKNHCQLQWLQVVEPSREEEKNPSLYGERVRELIAKSLKVELVDACYADKVEYHQHLNKIKEKDEIMAREKSRSS